LGLTQYLNRRSREDQQTNLRICANWAASLFLHGTGAAQTFMANRYTDAVHKLILPGEGYHRTVLKAVLTAMAWHTENKGGTFHGSHGTFAREANCSRSTVVRAVPELVELGLIEIIGQKPTRNGPCNRYRMNFDRIVSMGDQRRGATSSAELPVAESFDTSSAERPTSSRELPYQGRGATENSSLTHPGTRPMNSSINQTVLEGIEVEPEEEL
jgi:hypothetical protein